MPLVDTETPSTAAVASVLADTDNDFTSDVTAAPTFGGFSRMAAVIPLPHKPLVGKPELEYREHGYIGDRILLRLRNGSYKIAGDYPLTLQNGLMLTYGQINALAGDFYGTANPISDGPDSVEQQRRFLDAFYWLAADTTRQPAEAVTILGLMRPQVDAVNIAVDLGRDPSIVYNGVLRDITALLETATGDRVGIPTYLGLAQINWDEFGYDARVAYNAGHSVALQAAANGDLEYAYALNAFADHYLEDCFSAGHLRTPRRMLHARGEKGDLCAKYMHDEDNAIGLTVQNPAGESWNVYGDKRALDAVNAENLQRCLRAVRASADEVYAAFQSQSYPGGTFRAWQEAPTMASAAGPQTLAALFMLPDLCRLNLQDRRTRQYTNTWTVDTLQPQIAASPFWKYPISINGVQHIVPWTGVAACSSGTLDGTMVLYTCPDYSVRMSEAKDSAWVDGPGSATLATGFWFGAMASVTWRGSDTTLEAYLFYLDRDFIVNDLHYHDGQWWKGTISTLQIKMDWFGSMAATSWYNTSTSGNCMRLYLQEAGETAIQEFSFQNDVGHWVRGSTLAQNVLRGSSLAATVVPPRGSSQGLSELNVFFQTPKPECYLQYWSWNTSGGWYAGNSGWYDAAPGTGLAAALSPSKEFSGDTAMNIFYTGRAENAPLCQRSSDYGWQLNSQRPPVLRMNKILAAVASDKGYAFRLYCQDTANEIVELKQAVNSDYWTSSVIATP